MTERGALLGNRYELDQIIGRGGMAEVWRARDVRLERDVAVKRLRVDLASDPTFQARFRREAQSAAGLNHPNIVAVYDTGEQIDQASQVSVPYIIMELVEGITLREVLRGGRKLVPERALEFTAGVLDALAYSHRAGIIHRDIKPANVMMTSNGTVKVMDFGIARAVADTSATMTQTAAVVGTAQYLSPEQARGEKVDNRSDIYSVGCLLYELLTSQPLFKGDSPVSVAYQHVREQPVPPSQIDPEVTPEMDAIVLKSLAKDPRDRYQDASEFREDILRAMNGQPVLAGAPVDVPTQVIPSDPMTATARRGVMPAEPPLASAPSPPPEHLEDLDKEEEEEEEEPKSRTGVIVLGILGALVLIGLLIGLWFLLNPGGREVASPSPSPSVTATTPTPTTEPTTPEPTQTETTPEVVLAAVPDVIGQNQAAAERAITALGLVPVVETRAGTATDVGQVLETDPVAGTELEPGAEVTLYVSSGVDTRVIPEQIVGINYDAAVTLLTTSGFTNIAEAQQMDPADEPIDAIAGNVVTSNPAPGSSAAVDAPITLTIASGQSIVPRLTGLNLEQATAAAQAAGFEIEVTEEESTAQAPGLVFEQTPAWDEPLPRTEKIQVKIALAPATEGPPATEESVETETPASITTP
ncbi:Stk1 family PASTA domain-containing Ser/Thr kinase [Tessaracoccus massiliensis]|uniref:Stk1 family PASTA domain-containing Ser/Thr kinase n=1 Tax=Tessaracoccus massiliensis TaxID=1522311 RepID=UPI0006947788|nr:Stk1 family PASTA domain-containing Ser/Thr kinase [Tessaracoccus massiliensis]